MTATSGHLPAVWRRLWRKVLEIRDPPDPAALGPEQFKEIIVLRQRDLGTSEKRPSHQEHYK